MSKYRPLKVSFTDASRRFLKCRTTKVPLASTPEMIKDSIKHHKDRVRDLENILPVLEEMQQEDNRPSAGEILLNAANKGRAPSEWFRAGLYEANFYDKTARDFIEALVDESRITHTLEWDREGDKDWEARRKKAVSAVLARRQKR